MVLAACSPATSSSTAPSTERGTDAHSVPHWPAPADPMARTAAAGLVPGTHESLQHHVHAHLDVFLDGVRMTVPAGIGIDVDDPAVHRSLNVLGQAAYGGISVPCDRPCISPLHTHDTSGVLHTESAVEVDNTLGQFFVQWGVALEGRCVGEFCEPAKALAVYVDGKEVPDDAATVAGIALVDLREIAIVIGEPPPTIPDAFPTA